MQPQTSLIEIVAIVSGISTFGGGLLGAGIAWGIRKSKQKVLEDSHKSLKTEFIHHKDDRKIHIDPERDKQSSNEFKISVQENFDQVVECLNKIDSRCEKRGGTCSDHFAKIEKKIAAATGSANGGE